MRNEEIKPSSFGYRSKYIAFFLALFYGGFGLHHFYLGNIKKGKYYFFFCWTAIPFFIAPFTAFKLLFMDMQEFDTIYNKEFNAIPQSYYSLLIECKSEIENIINELYIDDAISTIFTEKKNIRLCVMYDMITIFKIIYDKNDINKKLERFGLALSLPEVLKNDDYWTICKAFNNNTFDEHIKNALLNDIPNPLKIENNKENGNNMIANKKTLSLPIFLKEMDNSLFEQYATVLYRFAVTIVKADGIEDVSETIKLKEVYNLIYNTDTDTNTNTIVNEYIDKNNQKPQDTKPIKSKSTSNETLEDVLHELNNDIIGLTSVKKEVNTLVNLINIQKQRIKAGLPTQPLSYHLIFTGNPGTGKTTVARIISKIYKHLGILKEGSLIETDRAGLIAEYVGQTAVKVNKKVDEALNNILFIDEAYSLVSEGGNDYGKEAVATLVKRMEDDRDKLVLIMAGYKNEMKNFIDTNPGFKSRFNKFIEFEDYTPDELYQIFELQCKKLKFNLAPNAIEKVKSIFTAAYQQRDKSFGNGRFVRNFFEKVQENQSNRIINEPTMNLDILTTIKLEDIHNG